jgi:hypothetical protein
MSDHIPTELQQPELQSLIVRSLLTAYEISQERHDPEVGDHAMTFGQHTSGRWTAASRAGRRS